MVVLLLLLLRLDDAVAVVAAAAALWVPRMVPSGSIQSRYSTYRYLPPLPLAWLVAPWSVSLPLL